MWLISNLSRKGARNYSYFIKSVIQDTDPVSPDKIHEWRIRIECGMVPCQDSPLCYITLFISYTFLIQILKKVPERTVLQ